jgi:hypothetical protein
MAGNCEQVPSAVERNGFYSADAASGFRQGSLHYGWGSEDANRTPESLLRDWTASLSRHQNWWIIVGTQCYLQPETYGIELNTNHLHNGLWDSVLTTWMQKHKCIWLQSRSLTPVGRLIASLALRSKRKMSVIIALECAWLLCRGRMNSWWQRKLFW